MSALTKDDLIGTPLLTLGEAKELKEKHKGRYPVSKAKGIVATITKEKMDQKTIRALKRKEDQLEVTRKKVDMWMEEYIRNGGNGTKAVQAVFGVESKMTASAMATDLKKKVPNLYREYLEAQGFNFGRLMEIALKKAEEDDDPRWWDRLMKLTGNADFLSKEKTGKDTSNVVNIIATEKDILSRYRVTDEIDGMIIAEEGEEELDGTEQQ